MGRVNASTNNPAAAPTGERAVVFEYCISCVALTLWRTSRVHVLKPGQWAWPRGLPYTLLTLLLGWWGVPWGVIGSARALWTNLTGGRPPSAAGPGPRVPVAQEAR